MRFISTEGEGRVLHAGSGKGPFGAVIVMVAALALAGCSAGDTPQPVDDIADVSAFQDPAAVDVATAGRRMRLVAFGDEAVTGPHVVAADGTLDLGPYGRLPVAGLTAPQIEEAIAARLAAKGRPGVRVSVIMEERAG